jgi:hypothetical protein
MKTKKVTLPKGNEEVFEALAEIAWSVEDRKYDKKEFFDVVLQELGKDAFLHSFTPSGEIGSGETMENPQTPRISKTFYEAIDKKILSKINNLFKSGSERVQKNRMFRFKSSTVNLVQLYLEAVMNLKTNDRKKEDRGKSKKENRDTSFNYKKRPAGLSDTEWYETLIEVEINRYTRVFVATIFFKTMADLFTINVGQMAALIRQNDMLNIDNFKDEDPLRLQKKKFKTLKSVDNRTKFIGKVMDLWTLELKRPRKKKEVQPELI